MKTYLYKNREVEILEYHFEPGEPIEVIAAQYVDDGTELTDVELFGFEAYWVYAIHNDLYENAYATMVDAIHSSLEGDR